MYCVIQEIELKKQDKYGHPKELISEFVEMSLYGKDCSHYRHRYSTELFERPIRKAYKISIHQSNREKGKVIKTQYPLCTAKYYEIAEGWFTVYDSCDKKITAIAQEHNIGVDVIYDMVYKKTDPLFEQIKAEFYETEEYKTNAEHRRITTLYATNKAKFTEEYGCNKDKYDEIYDVYGNLMSKDKLEEVIAESKARKDYEDASRRYQKEHWSNYKNNYTGNSGSSYSSTNHSNHNVEDKETLKQFYRVLSKKFHPDANPDMDTSKQMQLLNQLKGEWGL